MERAAGSEVSVGLHFPRRHAGEAARCDQPIGPRSELVRSTDRTDERARVARRHAQFTADIAELTRSRDTLAQRLSDAATTLENVRGAHTAETAAAADRLAQVEQALRATLAGEADTRAALEQAHGALERRLADAETARQEADERAAVEHAAAAQRLLDLEARLAVRHEDLG